MAHLGRLDLLCLDELGYVQIDPTAPSSSSRSTPNARNAPASRSRPTCPSASGAQRSPTHGSSPPSSTGPPSTPTSSKPGPSPTDYPPARTPAAEPAAPLRPQVGPKILTKRKWTSPAASVDCVARRARQAQHPGRPPGQAQPCRAIEVLTECDQPAPDRRLSTACPAACSMGGKVRQRVRPKVGGPRRDELQDPATATRSRRAARRWRARRRRRRERRHKARDNPCGHRHRAPRHHRFPDAVHQDRHRIADIVEGGIERGSLVKRLTAPRLVTGTGQLVQPSRRGTSR